MINVTLGLQIQKSPLLTAYSRTNCQQSTDPRFARLCGKQSRPNNWGLAQLVEQRVLIPRVTSSNLVPLAICVRNSVD